MPNTTTVSASSVPERQQSMSAKSTKKVKTTERDTLRAEYRREDLGKGVRGKYYRQHTQGTNLVLLQPEVAKVFTTPAAVNDALRGLIQVAQRVAKPAPRAGVK